MAGLSVKGFVRELRRRRVLHTAGLYILGGWLVMQAADVFFPAWGLPDAAINVLLVTAILGFPVALVFGWFYDITANGIVRTPAVGARDEYTPLPLQRKDYVLLGALGLIAAYIVYDGVQGIVTAPRVAASTDELTVASPDKLEHSIAVLPFANTSSDPDNEAFCDGISEEILHKLSNYAELHVIGRTSSFAFKGSDYRIPRIAALLGVRYLVQGSVRREGNDIRILASLVDEMGVQQWSRSYDRKLESMFAIQTEIADVVATTVVPKIVPQKVSSYEPDLVAYQQYLVGRDLLWRRDWGAAEALARATELDPNFADAHADLAIALLIGRAPELERSAQAIETALSLEPGLPRALAARGLLLTQQVPPDHAAAERVLREALAEVPDMVDALNWLSIALKTQGRHDEAFRITERAVSIDPLHGAVASNLAMDYAARGDTDRAEQILLRLLELPEPRLGPFLTLRDFYLDTGQLVKMNAAGKRNALSGIHVYYGLAMNYAVLGRWDDAERWVNLSKEDFPNFPFIPIFPQLIPYWQGRYGEAAALYRAVEQRLERLQPTAGYFYGEYRALAGDFDGAVATLEPLLEPLLVQVAVNVRDEWQMVGIHALAWAYHQTGRRDEALSLLGDVDRGFASLETKGLLHNGRLLFSYAQNALLLGDHDVALDRLERAVEAGWRRYLIQRHDPRWTILHDHPRYVALMQRVMADVGRQRTEVERIDAKDDFLERFEGARRLRQ
jgi:TolB-like protein/tetratricopeptide (TPR) repeat protein